MPRPKTKNLLRLEYVDAATLADNPRNWRRHPKRQLDALADIVAEVGFAVPLLYNERTKRLIDGHARKSISKGPVPVVIGNWSDKDEAKILATLDPLAAMADADDDVLAKLLADVESESAAVKELLAELGKHGAEPPPDPGPQLDKADELRKKWKTERGQLWVIGSHRLLCGDSTDAKDVARLMDGDQAGLCFTSPPYAQQRDYGAKIEDWDGLMRGAFATLPMADEGQVLVNLGLVHKDGEWWPYWDRWIEWMRGQGWRRFGWYVWDQGSGLQGDWNGRLAPSFEFIFHFNRSPVRPEKIRECKTAGRINRNAGLRNADGSREKVTTVVQTHAIGDSVIRVARQNAGIEHPAPYPVGLPTFMIESWPGLVYDPFLGSGTTTVAAQQSSSRCYGIEMEPKYVAVILERLAGIGLKPERA